jgi:hypothetical protein
MCTVCTIRVGDPPVQNIWWDIKGLIVPLPPPGIPIHGFEDRSPIRPPLEDVDGLVEECVGRKHGVGKWYSDRIGGGVRESEIEFW